MASGVSSPPAEMSSAARWPTTVDTSLAGIEAIAGSSDTLATIRSVAAITAPRGTAAFATTTSTDEVAAVHSHTPPSADSRSAATDAMISTGRRRVFTGPNAAGA